MLTGTSLALESLEPAFDQDLNGDGRDRRCRGGDRVGRCDRPGSGSRTPILCMLTTRSGAHSSNCPARPSRSVNSAQWTPLGVEPIAGDYQIVWKNGSADQYVVWTTDSNGNFLSQGAVLSGTSLALESLEPTFGQDLNGDSAIGVVAAGTSRRSASTDPGSGSRTPILCNAHGAPTGQQLKTVRRGRHGRSIRRVDTARRGADGEQRPDRLEERRCRSVRRVDHRQQRQLPLAGRRRCREPAWSLESLETTFHQDFNSDGTTGVVTSAIESFGSTTLAKVANTYSLYAHGTNGRPAT